MISSFSKGGLESALEGKREQNNRPMLKMSLGLITNAYGPVRFDMADIIMIAWLTAIEIVKG